MKKTTKVEVKVKVDASPKQIFIVEDNLMYLKTMQLFLKEKFPEAEISRFPLGELCLHSLHLNPDFIIMDYNLDTKYSLAANGLEMIKKIRAAKVTAQIIVLSSQEKIEVAVAASKNKGCTYVTKDTESFKKVASIIQRSVKKQASVIAA